MKFVARAYPSEGKVVIVREDGKVNVTSIYRWQAYLSKCLSGQFVHLCNRSIVLGYGNMWVGVVFNRQPVPEDLEVLKPLVDHFKLPDFVMDEAIALMYQRDSLFDLSCAGCSAGKELLATV